MSLLCKLLSDQIPHALCHLPRASCLLPPASCLMGMRLMQATATVFPIYSTLKALNTASDGEGLRCCLIYWLCLAFAAPFEGLCLPVCLYAYASASASASTSVSVRGVCVHVNVFKYWYVFERVGVCMYVRWCLCTCDMYTHTHTCI